MCLHLNAHSLELWLASQERILRAWHAEQALDPMADPAHVERLERHCQWLRTERERAAALAVRASEGRAR